LQKQSFRFSSVIVYQNGWVGAAKNTGQAAENPNLTHCMCFPTTAFLPIFLKIPANNPFSPCIGMSSHPHPQTFPQQKKISLLAFTATLRISSPLFYFRRVNQSKFLVCRIALRPTIARQAPHHSTPLR
jgi:hypothetical protein